MKNHHHSQTLILLPIGQLMVPLRSQKPFLHIRRGPQGIVSQIRLCIQH